MYWLFISTEGTYVGPRLVALLYDWTATRYDRIKNLHFVDEARFIGLPLMAALEGRAAPLVLDVATGTGRVPLAVLNRLAPAWRFVGLDRSPGMLASAQRALADWSAQVALVRGDASALPFAEGTFDAVACLEALEFMDSWAAVVAELARVVRPGGVLLLSNRVGAEARLFVGRLARRGALESCLAHLGLTDIRTERWQVHYDLVWARKAAPQQTIPPGEHEDEA
ncbi:MAG: methyltransferase domain-containing protein [Chloroflexota bacterium]